MIVCTSGSCAAPGDVEVTFLGVGGFMIKANGSVLLTAPHYTNPSPAKVNGRRLSPNTKLIDSLFPPAGKNANTILVGHGHYDHLLDVPHIASTLATHARIYGGPSIRNMLWGEPRIRQWLEAIPVDSAATDSTEGQWIPSSDKTFRFMAIRSNHAPAILALWDKWRYDWAKGNVPNQMDSLPRRGRDWKLGEPYAYLIEVLGPSARDTFRIYYQDTASDAPQGVPPAAIGEVDLAILCVSSATNARPIAPDRLLSVLRPKYVIASHWEYFFRDQRREIKRNPPAKFGKWVESMKAAAPGAEWSVPNPGAVYLFRQGR